MRCFLILLIVIPQLSSCYLARQGYRQAELLLSREPIIEVLKNKKLPEADRKKISFTIDVLEFAKSAGLNTGNSYRDYVELNGNAVSYIVQAAKPTEMSLKKWWFPIVGSVPYLGFFDRGDRDNEALRMERQGFEVYRGSVAAYSSLGWFADPLFSSMLRRSEIDLAHLYFHELTHRTVWLKDGVEFNENLAEFVADMLTHDFFTRRQRLQELDKFKIDQADYQLFKKWLRQLREDLEANLKSTQGQPELQRVEAKNKIISLAISKKPLFKQTDFVGSDSWNNARILAASLYSPDTEIFAKSAHCFRSKNDVSWAGNFLKTLNKKAETTPNGFAALEAVCQS
jgi:predicted aminopeptidase